MNESAALQAARAVRQAITVPIATVAVMNSQKVTEPIILTPSEVGTELRAWANANTVALEAHLADRGGILLRGFTTSGREEFEHIARTLCGDLMEYSYRSTPRTKLGGGIYTSTEYPPDQKIPQHNENSYAVAWPLRIAFYCIEPAKSGGETPTADSRRVFERIPAEIREHFMKVGVMYVRNYHQSIDLPWQEVFQTSSVADVKATCRRLNISAEWKADGSLRTTQVCQAAAKHPITNELVWFNQAHLFHISSLPASIRECLVENFGLDNLPRNAMYGDATPIEDGVMDQVRSVYEQEEVGIPWQAGDVMLLDNMLRSHGRLSFKGPRQVLVGMGGLTQDAGVNSLEGAPWRKPGQ